MKTTTHILFLIAIFLVSMVAQPAFAATSKKGKGKKKAKPEITHVGNTFYVGKEVLKGKQVLDFYAQQNCQAAYDMYKTGRNCKIAGWSLLGGGAAMTIIGLGCVIGGTVNTIGGAFGEIGSAIGEATGGAASSGSGMGRMNKGQTTILAGGILIGIGTVSQIVCIPLLIVGKKKTWQSADVYNVTCRTAQVRPYWSIQTSNNGLGVALNF